MKCDVCSTKIPIGGHQCPHCGYKMPVKKVSSFHVESTTHEHIGTIQQEAKQKTPVYKTNNELQKRLQEFKKDPKIGIDFLKVGESIQVGKVAKIIIGVFFILILISFSVSILGGNMNYNRFENLTFQEILDKEYDSDGTVQVAQNYKNALVKQFNIIGLTISDVDEYCNNDNGFYANTSVSAIVNNIDYTISATFEKGIMISNTLFVSGYSQTSLQDEFQGDKVIMTKLGQFINNDHFVDIVDKKRLSLTENELVPGELIYHNTNPDIYITQSQDTKSKLYHFTISYG